MDNINCAYEDEQEYDDEDEGFDVRIDEEISKPGDGDVSDSEQDFDEPLVQAICPPRLAVVREDPVVQLAPTYMCEHCPSGYVLESSLIMHIEAEHTDHVHICGHEDCSKKKKRYSGWALNLHDMLEHNALACECPFPSCHFRSQGKTEQTRRASFLSHFVRCHDISISSLHSLLRLNIKEVYGRKDMTEASVTYVKLDTHFDTTYAELLPIPEGLMGKESPKEPSQGSKPKMSHTYEKLLIHAKPRVEEEDILMYNRQRLAQKRNYNSRVRYREGITCPGPWKALSCPCKKTVSIANAILERRVMKLDSLFWEMSMHMPEICETCGAIKQLMNSMFRSGLWKIPGSDHSGTCDSPDCQGLVALGTQLCTEHALELVDQSSLFTPIRTVVQKTLSRLSHGIIRTPSEAAEFLSDPEQKFENVTPEETAFLLDLRNHKDVYFTDTESVGHFLVEVSVIDSSRKVVFDGYIHHGCKTIEEIWALAEKRNKRKLTEFEEKSLRKAFGPPSRKKPKGHTMAWVAAQFLKLKKKAPSLRIAEWSRYPHDEKMYRKNLAAAGYDPNLYLPSPSNWVSPMTWLQNTQPSLAGYSLGYVACLFAPSELPWRWHGATPDAYMLLDVVSTRSKKVFDREVVMPPPPVSIQRLFENGGHSDANSLVRIGWCKTEEDLCFQYIAEQVEQNNTIWQGDLLNGASYFLNGHNYYRTASAIRTHLGLAMSRSNSPFTFSSDKKRILTLIRKALVAKVPRSKRNYRPSAPTPMVKETAETIVDEAYRHLRKSAESLPVDKQFWLQCRRNAHDRVEAHSGVTKQDVDLALLVKQNGPEASRCIECDNVAYGRERCNSCYVRKLNKICLECQEPTGTKANRCWPCKQKLNPRGFNHKCVICNKECREQVCRAWACRNAAAELQNRPLINKRAGQDVGQDLEEDQQDPGNRPRLSPSPNNNGVLICSVPGCENPRGYGVTQCQACFNAAARAQLAESRPAYQAALEQSGDKTCCEEGCQKPKDGGRKRCTDCHKEADRRRRAKSNAKQRQKKAEGVTEEQIPEEPEIPEERICRNLACQRSLHHTEAVSRGRCALCASYYRNNGGKERPKANCDKTKEKIEANREQYANRVCTVCKKSMPSGATVTTDGRCGPCRKAQDGKERKAKEKAEKAKRDTKV